MAERRMFSKAIIDSDAFLDMPTSTRLLYFDLNMRADDDGFVNGPKKIIRMTGASDDDLRILIAKNFIIPFDSGVIVIKHWKINNYIKKDRYKETIYKNEKALLSENENKEYILAPDGFQIGSIVDTDCIQTGSTLDTQVSIGKSKDSIGESKATATKVAELSSPKLTFGEFENVQLTQAELDKLNKRWSTAQVENMIENLSSYLVNNTKKKYKNHYAVLLTWLKKDFPANQQADEQPSKTILIEEAWCRG